MQDRLTTYDDRQPYLDSFQKRTYLLQQLSGAPLKAVRSYINDSYGYIASLKRFKYMFGNPSIVAEASGPQLYDNVQQMSDFYCCYELHCLVIPKITKK